MQWSAEMSGRIGEWLGLSNRSCLAEKTKGDQSNEKDRRFTTNLRRSRFAQNAVYGARSNEGWERVRNIFKELIGSNDKQPFYDKFGVEII